MLNMVKWVTVWNVSTHNLLNTVAGNFNPIYATFTNLHHLLVKCLHTGEIEDDVLMR